MDPVKEFGEVYYAHLLKARAEGDGAAEILLADGWLPISSYKPSTEYAFVKFPCAGDSTSRMAVASRGWHPLSYWYGTDGQPLAISHVYAWKRIEWAGHESWRAYLDTIYPPAPPWVRPPEPVFEPGPADVRLTNEPFQLLQKLCVNYSLKELIGREWDSFKIQPVDAPAWEKVTCRPVDRLREQSFIARVGTPPPGRPKKMIVFDWVVTDAGRAWLAANPTGWKKPKAE